MYVDWLPLHSMTQGKAFEETRTPIITSTSMMIISRAGWVMCMFSSQHFRLISHSQYPANQEDCFVVNFHSVPWLPTQYLFWSPLNSVSQSIPLQLVCMWWHCQTSLLVAMTSEQQNNKMLAGMLATKWSKNVLTDVHFMYLLLHLVMVTHPTP